MPEVKEKILSTDLFEDIAWKLGNATSNYFIM